MYKIQGWVEKGNTIILTSGLPSSNKAQGSFPSALVTVYIHGTGGTLASLFSDDNVSPTPLANPFTSNSDGSFGFYAVTGRYDVVFSGGALTAPVTVDDVTNGAGGGSGDVVGPVSAVNNDIAVFDGVTGKLIKDGGTTVAALIAAATVPVSISNGRLTLAPGFPVFAPQPATPSSTNTSTEIVTFAVDPGWPTGTIVTPASTLAGLTAGTRYFFGRLSSVTGAFYTTVANANANTSKVDLTANVTQQINPSGISQTSLQYSPYLGNQIALWSGTAWNIRSFAETSIPLGTLSNDQGYDVFCYDNAGTPAFELLAWTSKTARATAIVLQNGVPVKSGDATRRLVGSFLTDSTTTTIDDAGGLATQTGGKRYVSNSRNALQAHMRVFDSTASWTYSTNTWRQANAGTGNKVECFVSLNAPVRASLLALATSSSSAVTASNGINLDSITAQPFAASGINVTTSIQVMGQTIPFDSVLSPGYHFLAWMETGNGTGTSTFVGRSVNAAAALTGAVEC